MVLGKRNALHETKSENVEGEKKEAQYCVVEINKVKQQGLNGKNDQLV